MSESESPARRSPGHHVTVEDVRELTGAATPHFALHVRERMRRLVARLAADDPARLLAQHEMDKLKQLATSGERRGGAAAGEAGLNVSASHD